MTVEVSKAETRFISNDVGSGLFATEDLEAGDCVIRVKDPYVLIPRNSVLSTLCYGCLSETTNLKSCSGCKTVKYCSKSCQNKSWRDIHKLECKVFRKCKDAGHPVLPTPVRGLIQTLVRHPYGMDLDPGWSHLETKRKSFMAEEEIWQDIQLQAGAALKYVGLSMDMMLVATTLLCAFKINAFNATQPDDTPIGLCFEPLFATANHSCVANTLISFDGRAVSFKAVRPIRKGQEITIHYVDTNQPLDIRQSHLKERYFFTCSCSKCLGKWNVYNTFLKNPCRDANELWMFNSYEAVEREALNANAAAINELAQNYEVIGDIVTEANAEKTIEATHSRLQHAMSLLKEVPGGRPIIATTPYPVILRALIENYIFADEIEAALVLLLITVFHVQPYEFPEPWHPIRIATLRGVATLISQILAAPKYSLQRLRAIPSLQASEVDLFSCVCAILLLVAHDAPRSHGPSSKLYEGVQLDLIDIERYANDYQHTDCLKMLKAGIRSETGRLTAGKYFRQLESLADVNLMSQIIDSVDCAGNGHNEAFELSRS